MGKALNLAVLGLSATFVVGGVTLLLATSGSPARVAGVLIIAVGVLIPVILWLNAVFMAERAAADTAINATTAQLGALSENVISKLQSYTQAMNDTADRLGVQNDARFLPEGFIGLQRSCLALDEDTQVGPDRVRMAIMGHLPSYMRLNELTDERGRRLYENWEPPHLVSDYVRLINRRSAALRKFVEAGGVVREIYDETKLSQYAARGWTFHDRVKDPPDEILDRLRALIHYLAKPNYYICMLGEDEDRPGPYFLLKERVGLVIDLRTTETQKHFTKSLDGLYTNSPTALEGFEEKFRLTWRQTEKDKVLDFLSGLVRKISAANEQK
jgi:hypothetical protein